MKWSLVHRRHVAALGLALVTIVPVAHAQQQGGERPGANGARPRPAAPRTRADSLYVSADPADHPQRDHAKDVTGRVETDSIYAARSNGVMKYEKITYKSSAGGMMIPAYVYQPLSPRGPRAHAALVFVHGGVHGRWTESYLPFVKEAVQKGYVVIAPDYRGSTGYGADHYNAIDYGGWEVDDVRSAVDYLKSLPIVDPDRIGVMGWSHGGMIASLLLFDEKTPFKSGAAIVPVSNLVFRLGYKGPRYARSFATQARLRGLPHEKNDEYIKRSPVYNVEKLRVPILVHVATNDEDVNYVEDVQLVWALRSQKPELAETKVYVDPTPGPVSVGHTFSRRVNPTTLERDDSPEQIDSWNLTWAFFERTLNPERGGR